ncbi:hypothetical protein [Fimbriiglobus ruber]|uniref:hypothetical protein n=1 Tax=Fimbriiglobus ruber TaxID=1908690 RepID=UPI0019310877|nr:hypothetical protein [Fimbriiglobus ruber]
MPATTASANPKSTWASPGGWVSGRNTSFAPTRSSRTASLTVVYPLVNACSSRNRCQMRRTVCFCFFGAEVSSARICRMTGRTDSIVGRRRGWFRRYPGGSSWARIFFGVAQWISYVRQA